MTTIILRELAGQYRTSPGRRAQILRQIYRDSGKTGLNSLLKLLGCSSVAPFINWIEIDLKNKNRGRRKQRANFVRPPLPPGQKDYTNKQLLEELSPINEGYKTGKMGGRRSIYSGQAWDAINGGGR